MSVWEQEFVKMPMPKQLAMAYLANDILQNSRKKGPEFVHEFYRTLPRAVRHMLKHGDEKVKRAINRLVDVWDERKASMLSQPLLLYKAQHADLQLNYRCLATAAQGLSETWQLRLKHPGGATLV